MQFSDWVPGDDNFTGQSLQSSQKTADGTRKYVGGRIPVSKVICLGNNQDRNTIAGGDCPCANTHTRDGEEGFKETSIRATERIPL